MAPGHHQRLGVLHRLIAALGRSDPGRVAGLATEGVRLAVLLSDGAAISSMSRSRGAAYLALGRYEPSLEEFAIAYDYYSERNEWSDAASVGLEIARVYTMLGDIHGAAEWQGRSLEMAHRADDLPQVSRALEMKAELYTGLGDYTGALEQYLQSLAIHEHEGDLESAGAVLSSIGILYGHTGDYDAANDYFLRSLASFRTAGNKYLEVNVLMNLGNILLLRGAHDDALRMALTVLTIYEALGERMNVARALVMTGNIHERRGSLDLALEFQRRAYSLVDRSNDEALQVMILLNIARLDIAAGAFEDALFVLDQALRIAEAIDDPQLQYGIHESLAETYEQIGLPAKALAHHKLFARMRNDIAGREKQKALAELQVKFDIEKAEREREIYRLRAERLESEMRLKQNELAAMALNLVQKKELLEVMKGQLEELRQGKGKGKNGAIEKIVREIEGTQHADDDWKMFEQQLDNLHQDFIHILSERYPGLTPTELKICSLTRINLQTKDVANLLFTSIRTIHAHKYNIRKKLALASGANLTTFLAGL